MRGRRRRSAATSASSAASRRWASAPPTTPTRCSQLKPECVVYNPMWIDFDELARILSADVNMVATASFITGHNLGAGRDRIADACRKGGSTIFDSGVSPGFR
jgi:hypothetical protein